MATGLLCRVHGTIYNVPENWNAHKGKSKDAQLSRAGYVKAAENLIKQSNIKGAMQLWRAEDFFLHFFSLDVLHTLVVFYKEFLIVG